MTGPLRTEEDIRAAGAEAVTGWQLADWQIDRVVAVISPVAAEVQTGRDERDTAADAA